MQLFTLTEAAPHSLTMKISKDHPCYYFTSVTNKRPPVFRTDKLKEIVAKAINEARKSGGFLIFAYVIMLDHYHLITDGNRKPSEVLRFLNGITARRVIEYLKEFEFEEPLKKLRKQTGKRNYRHSLWQHHPNTFQITVEKMFMQKVNYIHQNPVKAGLVKHPDDYLYSSSRTWNRSALDDEPLEMDIDQIEWRRG